MFDAPANELSSTPAASRMAPTSGLPRGYVAAWSGLVCLAGLYITQVALETVNIPQMIASGPSASDANPDAVRAHEAELATLRHSLGDFQRDVARVRAEFESRKLDATMSATLSALEERMSMTTGIAVAKAATPADAPSATASSAQAPAVTSAAALDAWVGRQAEPTTPAPAAGPRPIALAPPSLEKLTAPIETGSIQPPPQLSKMNGQLPKSAPPQLQAAVQAPPAATPAPAAAQPAPIAFGPALVKAEPKPFAVQLASGTSIDEIRYSWSILSEQHAENLSKLQPRYTSTTSETAGATYDLLAGPVKTAADAKRICKALASRGIDCKVAPYSGEAF